MGAFLSSPKTEKEYESGKDQHGREYCVAGMQGWRVDMEDAHLIVPALDSFALYGVFDGHGGPEVSKYVARHFEQVMKDTEGWKAGDIGKALKQTFLQLDVMIASEEAIKELTELSGGPDGSEEPVDLEALARESNMPIQQLLAQYGYEVVEVDSEEESVEIEETFEVVTSSKDDDGNDSTTATKDENEPAESRGSRRRKSKPTKRVVEESTPETPSDAPKRKRDDDETATGAGHGRSESEAVLDTKESHGDHDVKRRKTSSDGSEATEEAKQESMESDENWKKRDDDDEEEEEEEEDDDDDDDSDGDEGEQSRSEEAAPADQQEGDLEQDDDESSDQFEGGVGVSSGTTANVALVSNNKIIVANAGDCRAVLCRDGVAKDLSEDHKPEDEPERKRIEAAGGVISNGRVNDGLNLSRAIGDLYYKRNADKKPEEQMISAEPDITQTELSEEDEFLVIACDGIWNSMESQPVVDFVRVRLSKGMPVKDILTELLDACMSETMDNENGLDNETALIVVFKDIKGKEVTPLAPP